MEDIKELTQEQLRNILIKDGFPRFSASQVFSWIYKRGIEDPYLMTDLSKKVRDYLAGNFRFSRLELKERKISRDKAEKFLFRLEDASLIETVLIPERERNTLCISSQVGCRFRCKFCVSGLRGFERNLSCAEIINQFLEISGLISPQKITNIVLMGVGEPLDNFDNAIKAIRIFMDNKGIYLGKRKICISTAGLVPQIKKLIELHLGVRLSISLHSADESIRSKIMPVNKKYPLSELMKVLRQFMQKEKTPVTFEYILIKGVNSSKRDALKLAGLVKGMHCKINLIPYSPSAFFKWEPPLDEDSEGFKKVLKSRGVFSTLRKSRGLDIEAACGQLRAQFPDK